MSFSTTTKAKKVPSSCLYVPNKTHAMKMRIKIAFKTALGKYENCII